MNKTYTHEVSEDGVIWFPMNPSNMTYDSYKFRRILGTESKSVLALIGDQNIGHGGTTGTAAIQSPKTTLPTDSNERKTYPMLSGCLKYFPAALAGVAKISKLGNDKHNPGQPLHHARSKSTDHGDCVVRHLVDTEDLLAAMSTDPSITPEQVLLEANQLAWRALAYCQVLHEKFGAPLAPGAKKD